MALFGLGIKYCGDKYDVERARRFEKTIISCFGKEGAREVVLELDDMVGGCYRRGIGVGQGVWEYIGPRILELSGSTSELAEEVVKAIHELFEIACRLPEPNRAGKVLGIVNRVSEIAASAASIDQMRIFLKSVTRRYYSSDDAFYRAIDEASAEAGIAKEEVIGKECPKCERYMSMTKSDWDRLQNEKCHCHTPISDWKAL